MNTFCETPAHALIFIYASPQQKPKRMNKKETSKAKQRRLENGSWAWQEIRWILERAEPSLPAREIPHGCPRFPDGNQVRGRVGANGARHSSFISDGYRFYSVRIIHWVFFPRLRLTPRGEAGCRQGISIAAPAAKHQPNKGREACSLGGCARLCTNVCIFKASI